MDNKKHNDKIHKEFVKSLAFVYGNKKDSLSELISIQYQNCVEEDFASVYENDKYEIDTLLFLDRSKMFEQSFKMLGYTTEKMIANLKLYSLEAEQLAIAENLNHFFYQDFSKSINAIEKKEYEIQTENSYISMDIEADEDKLKFSIKIKFNEEQQLFPINLYDLTLGVVDDIQFTLNFEKHKRVEIENFYITETKHIDNKNFKIKRKKEKTFMHNEDLVYEFLDFISIEDLYFQFYCNKYLTLDFSELKKEYEEQPLKDKRSLFQYINNFLISKENLEKILGTKTNKYNIEENLDLYRLTSDTEEHVINNLYLKTLRKHQNIDNTKKIIKNLKM